MYFLSSRRDWTDHSSSAYFYLPRYVFFGIKIRLAGAEDISLCEPWRVTNRCQMCNEILAILRRGNLSRRYQRKKFNSRAHTLHARVAWPNSHFLLSPQVQIRFGRHLGQEGRRGLFYFLQLKWHLERTLYILPNDKLEATASSFFASINIDVQFVVINQNSYCNEFNN